MSTESPSPQTPPQAQDRRSPIEGEGVDLDSAAPPDHAPAKLGGIGGWAARLDLRWWEAGGYGALLLVGLAMRLWELGARAMHHDESLHALYSWNLSNGAEYIHNPMMHGPFQFEANAALFLAFGDSDVTARLLYAIAGTVLIALPLLLRTRLGRGGALFAATLLAASPAMLYYSRFARNDILMAVWTLGLVICMWRFFDEGRRRYIYLSAALLALMFATKESAYMVVATLGLWAFVMASQPRVSRVLRSVNAMGASPPAALWRVFDGFLRSFEEDPIDLKNLSRPAAYLAMLVSVTLPLWAAASALFEDSVLLSWSGLTLVAPEGSARIGEPVGGAVVLAFVIVAFLVFVAAYIGRLWNWSIWWRCALIFYSIWTLLYTTFLTNFYGGIKSGVWQALGYWIVQQGEGRGNQPWYYYFALGSVYEFLPLFVGIVAAVYLLRRRDRDGFSAFLVYWALTTFLLYTIASEKMPWLLVNIALPFIVLVGKFLADVARRVDWRLVARGGGYLLIPGAPLFCVLLWNLAGYPAPDGSALGVVILVALVAALLAMAAFGAYISRAIGGANMASVSLLAVVALLLALSVRAGAIASYRNGDTPVEMLVYTQTSPDVVRALEALPLASGDAPIAIDATSGFSWPWAWYLRDEDRVSFPAYGAASFKSAPSERVLIVHSNNRDSAERALAEGFSDGERVRHRWWFPEHRYRDLTPTEVIAGIARRETWRAAMGYWLNRDGVFDELGSEDSYLYYKPDEVSLDYAGAP